MGDGKFINSDYKLDLVALFCFIVIIKMEPCFSEDVIRRRLLIDGDGTGDDRRLNVLLKTLIKWCNSADEKPEERLGFSNVPVFMTYLFQCYLLAKGFELP